MNKPTMIGSLIICYYIKLFLFLRQYSFAVLGFRMSKSQKHGRGKGRRRERMVPSFLWCDVRIYLPYIFIPQDLRRVADNYSLENKKSQSDHSQKSEDENWNPSWSDDEEDEGNVTSHGYLNFYEFL